MRIKNILYSLLALFMIAACEDGIDPINPVDPGPDETAPQIVFNYPKEGIEIESPEQVIPLDIDFVVTDDIELQSVTVSVNGTQIAGFTEFIDYRRFLKVVRYDNLADGNHTVTITATDINGKSTTKTVNFAKVPPYIPVYEGEIFYMPFDGEFREMISFTQPTVVGNPGFTDNAVVGQAYKGAAGSYLTFPASDLHPEEFSAVFWLDVTSPPDRAGILVMSPVDPANPNLQNLRTSGFRFFREGVDTRQVFKLNVGTGDAESWFDGGDAAAINPAATGWVHFAFTIEQGHGTVYINGQVVSENDFAGIDWAGADLLTIMSGAPRFTGWNHLSDVSTMDELRLFNRALSQAEIQAIIAAESGEVPGYEAKFGEIFYMPFNGDYVDAATDTEATVVGSPGFSDEAIEGQAYSGAADSYLTFPGERFQNGQISAAFWLNANPTPNRAGILVMGPEDTENAEYPVKQNLRTSGFRFFREAAGTNQIFKLNVGTGEADTWFDGGQAAQVDPTTGWHHYAFSISGGQATVFIDGEVVSQGDLAGIDWTGTDLLSIMSGAPRFTGWDHFSDLSLMDELYIFDKALSQEEVQNIMNSTNQ